jgi:hypothetical protein
MIKRLLFSLLLLPLFALGQFQGGVIVVNGVAVHQPDTSAYKVINTIQSEGTALNGASRFYVTYLTSSLRSAGVWSKIRALYGFVGGTAASHKWNWRDMRDLNAAFRLTFPNGMTHSANGIQGNGTNQYAETFFNPAANLTNNNSHLSFYSNSNISGSGFLPDISAADGTTRYFEIVFDRTTGNHYTSHYSNAAAAGLITDSKGFSIGTRTASNRLAFFNKNNSNIATRTETQTLPSTASVNIGVRNAGGIRTLYSNRAYQFDTIGDGLTDTQAIQASNIITFAQSILNRR